MQDVGIYRLGQAGKVKNSDVRCVRWIENDVLIDDVLLKIQMLLLLLL
jgi:hypothetical protein